MSAGRWWARQTKPAPDRCEREYRISRFCLLLPDFHCLFCLFGCFWCETQQFLSSPILDTSKGFQPQPIDMGESRVLGCTGHRSLCAEQPFARFYQVGEA